MQGLLRIVRGRIWHLIGAAFVLIVAVVVGLTDLFPTPKIIWSTEETSVPNQYRPSFTIPQENDILLVYIGSSTCGFANNPELPEIIERAKIATQQHAVDTGFSFSAIGVSIDWDPTRGHAHLAKMGHFDETMTGRRNWGVGFDIWQEFVAGTPQVLVVRHARNEQLLPVVSDNVVVRKAGFNSIANWVNAGTPLPPSTKSSK